MSNFTITQEEKELILEHRRRQQANQRCTKPVQNSINPNAGPNVGRLPQGHPLNWFEKDVFTKIGNIKHRSEHAKIRKSGMKVQADNRDRVYHILTHMDIMWTNPIWDKIEKENGDIEFVNGRPSPDGPHPLMTEDIKIMYEKYKKKYNIGDDNMNPLYKAIEDDNNEEKYPKLKLKREFSNRVWEELDAYQPSPGDGL